MSRNFKETPPFAPHFQIPSLLYLPCWKYYPQFYVKLLLLMVQLTKSLLPKRAACEMLCPILGFSFIPALGFHHNTMGNPNVSVFQTQQVKCQLVTSQQTLRRPWPTHWAFISSNPHGRACVCQRVIPNAQKKKKKLIPAKHKNRGDTGKIYG